MQPFRDAVEGEPDLEIVLGDLEVPELVLEDDRHLLRIARLEAGRYLHALGAGIEGDEEVVLAGKPLGGGFGEHRADDTPQGVLG